jgi:hypothetical protein
MTFFYLQILNIFYIKSFIDLYHLILNYQKEKLYYKQINYNKEISKILNFLLFFYFNNYLFFYYFFK